jgi:hypothetical protein
MIAELRRILFAEDSVNDAELTLNALKAGGLANEDHPGRRADVFAGRT